MKYLVLGAGRMSYGIVHDFLEQRSTGMVYVTDFNQPALDKLNLKFGDVRIKTILTSADDEKIIRQIMEEVDGAISAVPYDYNLQLTRWAIETGTHFVDLGGNNTVVNSQFTLNDTAKKAGIGIIPDCGLAPGMASVVAAFGIEKFDSVDSLKIRVGGLPLDPRTPLNYMLVFSVHGLINEYIEPAVVLENGQPATVASMTEIEALDFPRPFGRLEAFYTSGGTSTLPKTFQGKIQHLDYKTIRYPGHCQLMKAMIDMGFTSSDGIETGGQKLPARDIFESLLSHSLSYPGKDVVLIRVSLSGTKAGKPAALQLQAIEYEDTENELTAMMRTTAFPAAIILEMLCDGRIGESGVLRQELSVPAGSFMEELAKRNIHFSEI